MKSRMKKCQGGSELFKDLSVTKKEGEREQERQIERDLLRLKKKARNIILNNVLSANIPIGLEHKVIS